MNLLVILMLVATSIARLVSYNEVENLFKKYVRGQLTKQENETLSDVFKILQMNQYVSRETLDKTTGPRVSLMCMTCRAAGAAILEGVNAGFTDDELSSPITQLCTTLRIETYKVCKGAVNLNLPIITYILRNTPEAAPSTFCGLIMQKENDPNACAYDDPRFEWQVDLPDIPTVTKRVIPKHRNRPLHVALITDIHLDPLYEAGGVANCAEPACCRKGQTVSQAVQSPNMNDSIYSDSFIKNNDDIALDLSFVSKLRKIRKYTVLKQSKTEHAGYWGDYRNCDTPLWTFDSLIDRIAEAHEKTDVVYYIGDTNDHHHWEATYERNQRMNDYLIRKLRKTLKDDVVVVPVIGNYDSHPFNVFAPASERGNELNTTWLYKSLAKTWGHYLPKDARATFWKYGVYSMRIRPGLKAIVINSNIAYKLNWWLVYNPLDAKRHLEWLVDELYKAELNGDKVHILSHIPPGDEDLTYTWTREYNRIVNRFAPTIAAEFNGHRHSDEFRIFYNPEGGPTQVAWNGGGLTTFSSFNPNYKIIKFHHLTHEPTDIDTYIFDLAEANLKPKREPHWFKLYDFKKTFGLYDLSPVSMDDLVLRLTSEDNDLLDVYTDYVYKMSAARPLCDTDCKLEYLCRTVVTVLWDRRKCNEMGLMQQSGEDQYPARSGYTTNSQAKPAAITIRAPPQA